MFKSNLSNQDKVIVSRTKFHHPGRTTNRAFFIFRVNAVISMLCMAVPKGIITKLEISG